MEENLSLKLGKGESKRNLTLVHTTRKVITLKIISFTREKIK